MMTGELAFLGGSQTFLGVLATLTILCVFANSGNFIMEILKDVSNRIEEQVERLKEGVRNDPIQKSDQFALLKYYIESADSSPLKEQGAKLLREINSKFQAMKIDNMGMEYGKESFLKETKESKELLLAPFYTFLFCVVIFLYDEALRCSFLTPVHDKIISSMAIFICLSYVYWGIVWVNFILSQKFENNDSDHVLRENSIVMHWHKKFVAWVTGLGVMKAFFVRLLICVLFLLGGIFILSSNTVTNAIVLFLAICLPGSFMGIYKIRNGGKVDYTHLMTTGHFVVVLIASVVFSILIHKSIDWGISGRFILLPCTSFFCMKLFMLAFALLNGLILPFLIPYCCFVKLQNEALKSVFLKKQRIEDQYKDIEDKLKQFCEKIPR